MALLTCACSTVTGDPSQDLAPGTHPAEGAGSGGGIPIDNRGEDNAADSGAIAKQLNEAHGRADQALEQLLRSFWRGDLSYLAATPTSSDPAGYWIFAQGLEAVLDGFERTRGRYPGLVETFFNSQSERGFESHYADEMNWMALALTRAYDLTGQAKYLDPARARLETLLAAAQDTTCCGEQPGGLWKDEAHTQKTTAVNMSAVMLAARLAKLLDNPAALDFAKSVYAYWWEHMVDPASHQVADHLDAGGAVTWQRFTYNEGATIGASIALYQATEDRAYLDNAHAVAAFMVANETVATRLGPVLYDGDAASCSGDCTQFKGVGFRYLAALHQIDPSHPEYRSLLLASAQAAWTIARSQSGLFGADWSQRATETFSVEGSLAAATALSGAASVLGPYPAPHSDVLQAEESVIHHINIEAARSGFEGWGYLAGWNHDGQSVDFSFEVAKQGIYALDLRYAAGDSDVRRVLYLNGAPLVDNQLFSITGAWDTYATASVQTRLPAGRVTVSVAYKSSKGSHGFLNLDRLRITRQSE